MSLNLHLLMGFSDALRIYMAHTREVYRGQEMVCLTFTNALNQCFVGVGLQAKCHKDGDEEQMTK